MIRSIHRLSARLRDESGATAVEYALLVALIAAVIAVTIEAVGLKVYDLYTIAF